MCGTRCDVLWMSAHCLFRGPGPISRRSPRQTTVTEAGRLRRSTKRTLLSSGSVHMFTRAISYGSLDNLRLLLSYGFALPHNPHALVLFDPPDLLAGCDLPRPPTISHSHDLKPAPRAPTISRRARQSFCTTRRARAQSALFHPTLCQVRRGEARALLARHRRAARRAARAGEIAICP